MELREQVRQKMSEVLRLQPHQVADEAKLTGLVPESFMLIEMVIELQDAFDVRLHQEDLQEIHSVGQLLSLIEGRK